jgi:hypothetical protein
MSLLAKNLDYTDRDFDSIRLRLQGLIRSVYPTWTDFNVASFGSILLELFSFVGDTLTFYQDNQAGESRIATATQRKNLIALCKLIGFVPSGARAATADISISLRSPPVGTVTLPAGTFASTADVTSPVEFQLLADAVFSAGQNPPTITATVENSVTETDTFTSTGLPNQSFSLASTPYIDDTAAPTASDGAYTQVDNFLESSGTDRHFTIVVDQNDKARIVFGNGVTGKIPVGTITVVYKTGGGSLGNVEATKISRMPGSFTDSLGNAVNVSVTNPSKASGGLDRQTNQQIQLLAPASLTTQARSVARTDFEINALTNTSIARALMLTSNEDASIAENNGILFVVPVGGGLPSTALKAAVLALFISTMGHPAPFPCTVTFGLAVQDPNYLVVNIFVRVYFRTGVAPNVGAKAIRTAATSFFSISNPDGTPNERIDFGFNFRDENGNTIGTVPLSDIFDALDEVAEVLRIGGAPSDFLLNGAHADVPIALKQFPQLGTVTIMDATTGGLL